MSDLLTTILLEKYVISMYDKAISLIEGDGINVSLTTVFYEPLCDNQGEFCFTDNAGYHFKVLERGVVYHDIVTQSLFEITYWAIKGTISRASAIYEAKNHINDQDFRRIMFARRYQYFKAIDGTYAQRAYVDIENALKKSPYQDDLHG